MSVQIDKVICSQGTRQQRRAGPTRQRTAVAVALSALVLTACGGAPRRSTSPPALAPTTTQVPAPFIAADGHFSAVFPVAPSQQSQPVNYQGGVLHGIIYSSETPDGVVQVLYTPLPFRIAPDMIRKGLDAGVDSEASAAGGTVTTRNAITYLDSPAEDAVINVASKGEVFKIRAVLIGSVIYELQGVTLGGPSPEYDELVSTFHTI
ncbi:MAG: hypothetical protein QOK20_512 [Acidimicrobiaceae bacterium]|nr:hypothetical protein [Acidimicrobiaceae bacterium]